MPRLLPRLLQRLAREPLESTDKPVGVPHAIRRRERRYASPPERPSFCPVGRTQSILLDPINPIVHSTRFARHKIPPPRVRSQQREPESDAQDRPRTMDAQEREWRASPYLRMLSSPERQCSVTRRHLPTDFMIRLAPFLVVSQDRKVTYKSVLPHGLEHPRFKTRKPGPGSYIICWKSIVPHLAERGLYARPSWHLHSRLAEQIGHLLRVRVLQELEFLADQLQTRPLGAADHPVLRRLTRREFQLMRTTGVVPDSSAVAVLIVPPLNRDPKNRTRTSPSSSSAFVEEESPEKCDTSSQRSTLPISTLLAPSYGPNDSLDTLDLSRAYVPLYNGVSLFPYRSQRAALHACLLRLLSIERRARHRQGQSTQLKTSPGNSAEVTCSDDRKTSHAFMLRSDCETALRADAAATAIALWRIRMWEGCGWEGSATESAGWVENQLASPTMNRNSLINSNAVTETNKVECN